MAHMIVLLLGDFYQFPLLMPIWIEQRLITRALLRSARV